MKLFTLALITAIAMAQADDAPASGSDAAAADNSTAPAAPEVKEPKVQNVALPTGKGSNLITKATATAVVTQPDELGATFQVQQKVIHNPAATGKAVAGHVVVSWINLVGGADDGKNAYFYGIAVYNDPDSPRAQIIKDKKCGIHGPIDGAGANSLGEGLTTENCTVVSTHSFLQTEVGDFFQSSLIGLTVNGTDGTLKLGKELGVSTGFASYNSTGNEELPLDAWQSVPVTFKLESATALAMTGVAGAVAAMTF